MKNLKATLAIVCIMAFIGCKMEEEQQLNELYVGTYTQGDSEGIYRFQFNSRTGELSQKELAAPLNNPSYIRFSPDKKRLYAVMETDEFDGNSGGIMAFDLVEGALKEKGPKANVGAHPCHIAISDDGKQLAVSSYTGGSVSLFALDDSGALLPDPQFIDLKSLDTVKTSHAHSTEFTPDGLFIADLGLDALKRYSYNGKEFIPHEQASLDLPDGAGPRHFTFGQNRRFLYVINELNSTITVFEKTGKEYKMLETKTTLADDFKGESFCADIHLSPDGKFLYGSNRGEQTIVIFKVDDATGKLTLVGREDVRGDWPRNFTIDPSGQFLLVANQKSDNITVFKRDASTGALTYLQETSLPSPVCLTFLE